MKENIKDCIVWTIILSVFICAFLCLTSICHQTHCSNKSCKCSVHSECIDPCPCDIHSPRCDGCCSFNLNDSCCDSCKK